MITFKHRGSFRNTERYLTEAKKLKVIEIMHVYGQRGVSALSSATPINTGVTAASWDYTIQISARGYRLIWVNTNVENGAQVALLIQYGHGTGSGGYVSGIDYINPALKPIFDALSESLSKEVSSL